MDCSLAAPACPSYVIEAELLRSQFALGLLFTHHCVGFGCVGHVCSPEFCALGHSQPVSGRVLRLAPEFRTCGTSTWSFLDLCWTRERVLVAKIRRCFVDLRFQRTGSATMTVFEPCWRLAVACEVLGYPRPPVFAALVYRVPWVLTGTHQRAVTFSVM